MLLMFGVGLHFSLDDLLAVKRIAIPGAIVADRRRHRAGHGAGHVLGLGAWRGAWCSAWRCRSPAPSCCCARWKRAACSNRSTGASPSAGWWSRIWPWCWSLVLLPPLAGLLGGQPAGLAAVAQQGIWLTLGITLRQGRRLRRPDAGRRPPPAARGCCGRSRAPARASCSRCASSPPRSASPTARPSCSACRSRSAPSSPAWCMRESEFSHRAAEESLPLRDAFAVLFFVSVGMLFDPQILVDEPLQVLAVVRHHHASASRSPPSPSCSPSAIRSTPR